MPGPSVSAPASPRSSSTGAVGSSSSSDRTGGSGAFPVGPSRSASRFRAATAREVREETGLEVTIRRLVGVYSDPELQVIRYPDGKRLALT